MITKSSLAAEGVMLTFRGVAAAIGLMLAFTCAPANALVVGSNAGGGNCFPFSCFGTEGGNGYEWQELYSSTAFSGTTTISSFSFYQLTTGLNQLDAGTYNVDFYSTGVAVGSLSTNLASNEGTLLSTFGTFTLGGTQPAVLTLSGNPFVYDPTGGNLLLDVVMTSLTTPCYATCGFFQTDDTSGLTQRAWSNSTFPNGATDASIAEANAALVTGFNVTATPLPSTWSMMLIGLAGFGFFAFRGNRKGSAAIAAA
jgi:hypothetical protein